MQLKRSGAGSRVSRRIGSAARAALSPREYLILPPFSPPFLPSTKLLSELERNYEPSGRRTFHSDDATADVREVGNARNPSARNRFRASRRKRARSEDKNDREPRPQKKNTLIYLSSNDVYLFSKFLISALIRLTVVFTRHYNIITLRDISSRCSFFLFPLFASFFFLILISDIGRTRTRLLLGRHGYARLAREAKSGRNACSSGSGATKPKSDLPAER